ncbi:MAG: hypothetical protein LHW56_01745 [Candidatus Cloacimonetes bacterium]|nr:hypothetical protein [Candidatus Cloacimonadota bacterium]MDY0171611.1 hypothetical protein [Candidatus Cloacimonadaceae bacterium]
MPTQSDEQRDDLVLENFEDPGSLPPQLVAEIEQLLSPSFEQRTLSLEDLREGTFYEDHGNESPPCLLSVDLAAGDTPVLPRKTAYKSFRHLFFVNKDWFNKEENRYRLRSLFPNAAIISFSRYDYLTFSAAANPYTMQKLFTQYYALFPLAYLNSATRHHRIVGGLRGASSRVYRYKLPGLRLEGRAQSLVGLCYNGVWLPPKSISVPLAHYIRWRSAPATIESPLRKAQKVSSAVDTYLTSICEITGGL